MFVFRKKDDGTSEYVGYAGGPVRRSHGDLEKIGKVGKADWAMNDKRTDDTHHRPYRTGRAKRWG